jgi:tetratricopeptide (TPR) repeat protein
MVSHKKRSKELKQPDQFAQTFRGIFEKAAQNPRQLLGALGAVILVIFSISAYSHFSEQKAAQGQEALYLAQETLSKEEEKVIRQVAEETGQEATLSSDAPVPGQEEGSLGDMADAQLNLSLLESAVDVEKKYPRSLEALRSVTQDYRGTKAAHEANLLIGNLYFRHGQTEKSIEWFESAFKSARQPLAKAVSAYSWGYALEALEQHQEAVRKFEQVLGFGLTPAKPDALLAKARNHLIVGESEYARAAYKTVIQEFPNTYFSRQAENNLTQIR